MIEHVSGTEANWNCLPLMQAHLYLNDNVIYSVLLIIGVKA